MEIKNEKRRCGDIVFVFATPPPFPRILWGVILQPNKKSCCSTLDKASKQQRNNLLFYTIFKKVSI